MFSKKIIINLENGLEARPVAMLVQIAGKFSSSIFIECGTRKVNAKSIMGMMALGIDNGDEITVTAEGEDAMEAVEAVDNFLTT